MPGVGGSPDALMPYGAPTMAASVMEIAERLGHQRLDLAGFSWGGALAQQIAVQFPGRIRRLILMATTPSVSARSEEHTSELQSLMRISYAVFCLKKKMTTSTTPSGIHKSRTRTD